MRLFKNFRPKETKYAYTHQGLFSQPVSEAPLFISPSQTMGYYKRVAPLAAAVNLISDECSSIDLALQDCETNEFIYDSDFTKFLYKPNPDEIYSEFIKALCTFYAVTGNTYIMVSASSPVTKPLEMYVVNPQFITIIGDYLPYTYLYTSFSRSFEFTRKEDPKYGLRYLSQDGKLELIHIKTFNPDMGSATYTGMSPLTPIWYELEQYINQSQHNLSVLKNGANPGAIVSFKELVSDDARQRITTQLNNQYGGAINSGRTIVVDGSTVDYKPMGMNNKDMDFIDMRREMIKMIYSALKIPLPLVSAESMTMNNYAQAQMNLYDNVVIPLMKKIAQELQKAFFPRFGIDPQKYEVSFDERMIPALRERYNMNIERMEKSGKFSINEIRTLYGYDGIQEGGDDVRQPANLLTVGAVENDESSDMEDDLIESYDKAIKAAKKCP